MMRNCQFGFGQVILYANKPHMHIALPTQKHQSEVLVMNDSIGKVEKIDWSPEEFTSGESARRITKLMAEWKNG